MFIISNFRSLPRGQSMNLAPVLVEMFPLLMDKGPSSIGRRGKLTELFERRKDRGGAQTTHVNIDLYELLADSSS